MYITQLNDDLAIHAYNILCQSLTSLKEMPFNPPFKMTYCIIEPNGHSASPHDHYDGEMFLILSGNGQIQILNEVQEISAGDLIFVPNYSDHELKNPSRSEPLRFISIYFDQPATSSELAANYLIYSTPPTPNGKLHIGHLSGPYFAADVCRRYLRLRGSEVTYCSGADESQSYVPAKARQLKRPTESLKVAEEYTEQILQILEVFSASPDKFLRPHADHNFPIFVQDFFRKLVESNALQLKTDDYPYCQSCDCFVHESNVSGECPHCSKKTNGNGCEACGLYNDCRDLIKPICNICGANCIKRKSERYVFSLASHKEKLTNELANKRLQPRLRQYVNRVLNEGLQEITVTYPFFWGIAAPGLPGQVIYAWLEMAAAYLYLAKQAMPDSGYEFFWKQPENKTLLAFGFDNSFFFIGLVPALMMSFDPEIKYPDSFLINFFYLLDGKKFSTSRNHAVWGDAILEKIDKDVIRFYLATTRPENSESNFTYTEFEDFIETTGVNGWDHLMSQLSKVVSLAKVELETGLSEAERIYLEYWQTLIRQCELAYDPGQQKLSLTIKHLESYRNSFLEFLEECVARQTINLRLTNAGLKGLAQILQPICPDYAKHIFTAIECKPQWNTLLDLPTQVFHPKNLPLDYFRQQLNRVRECM